MDYFDDIQKEIKKLEETSQTDEQKKSINNVKDLMEKFSKKPTYREEANAITHQCLRNGFIEDLHAGEHSEILNDNKFSRITQEEMKKLMIETSAEIATFLELREKYPEKYNLEINKITAFFTHDWEKNLNSYKIKNEN